MLTFLNALVKTYLLAIAAIAVLITGFAGHLMANFAMIVPESTGHSMKIVIDSFLQSMQLFTLSNRPNPGADNWALVLGRLGGALVAFGAIGKVLLLLLDRARQRARLATMRGHAVLCGFGERGRLFAAAAASSTAVVALDTSNVLEDSPHKRVLRLQGDAQDAQTLRQTNLARADTLVIGTGSDERNLNIATSAIAMLSPSRKSPLELILTLDDPGLVDMIEREDAVMRPTACRRVDVNLFNPARAAARALLVDPLWPRRALTLGQTRVRVAVFGATDAAVAVLLQFLRISPCAGLDRPEILVFGKAKSTRQQLAARAPSLMAVVDRDDASHTDTSALRWAARLKLLDCDPERDPARTMLERLDAPETLTAIVVAVSGGAGNIRLARNLRACMDQLGQPCSPIHLHSPNSTSLDSLLRRRPNSGSSLSSESESGVPLAATEDVIIEPFGRADALCRIGHASSPREILARRLHEAHCANRNQAHKVASAEDQSLKPWDELGETYRRASRRAADQLPMKWLAANHHAGTDLHLPSFPDQIPPEHLEALAAMEHDSWRIDRELDGWRHGETRDNKRLLHPDLVPYGQLRETSKEFCRQQIREILPVRAAADDVGRTKP